MEDVTQSKVVVREPVKKREIFGWAMYDFANSSYTTVIITAVYASFFTEFIVPHDSATRDSYWSMAINLSTILALTLSPFIGAVVDLSGRKKQVLFLTTVLCSILTVLLSTVGPGDVWKAVIIIGLSSAAFLVSESLCGSFLTDLATPKTMGKISGIGWAVGYFGGLACLIAVKFIVTATPESDLALFIRQNQNAVVMTGLFFLVASMPTFLFVKERGRPAPGFEKFNIKQLMSAGFTQYKHTLAILRENTILLRFLTAFLVYMAGLHVIISFVGIYARGELKFGTSDLVYMFLILQISAALGALAFGFLEQRIGPKNTVTTTLVWWIIAILAIFFLNDIAELFGSTPRNVFFVIALVAGAGLGSIQSSSRAVVGILAPPEHSAQVFGCWGAFSRASSILGMSFGFVSDALESRRFALLLVAAFFVVGGAMFWRIPFSKNLSPR